MQTTVKIWWDASIEAYRMTMTYNESLLEAFKLAIPASDRSYDKPSKIWTFTEKWLQPTLTLMKQLGIAQPTVVSRQQVEASSSASIQGKEIPIADVVQQFINVLPYESAQKAYRDAAMRLHPDRGGSMDKMSLLNVSWKRIEKEIYKQ